MCRNTDRAAVGMMLEGLNGAIDLIIPRGGKGLTGRVMREARVPVLAHLEGLCHVYVHAAADLEMARKVVLNAKMRRTSRLRRGRNVAAGPRRAEEPRARRSWKICQGRLRNPRRRGGARGVPARQARDRRRLATEYLDAIIAVRVVDGLEAAIAHIEHYGSHHTDSILTEDEQAAETFLERARQRHRAVERLDPVRRWRRVRHGRRDRHRHRQAARPRAGRRRAAHHLQICGARQRPNAPVMAP